ncbi:MAG: EamA family transporter [Hyphomicrobiales bacterium]
MHLSLPVFLAVLSAAALHAGWNALVKIRLDPLLAITLTCFSCGIIALPAVLVTGLPDKAAWPWIMASVAIHLGYYIFLAEAYRRADMGQIYPIARGSAPLLTALISLLVVADPVSSSNIVGIALLALGVLLISLRGHRHLAPPSRIAVSCALLTSVTITAYTIVDGVGARVSGNANAYAATLFAVDAYPILIICLWWKGAEGVKPAFGFLAQGFTGGAMSLVAYWIVIWAMTVAPIALVAAIRETSVLFGALIAVLFLKEPMTRVRAASAALILVGLAFMRLS